MAAKFEFVSRYADSGLPLPERKTTDSAGYDFVVAEDTIIPSYMDLYGLIFDAHMENNADILMKNFLRNAYPNDKEEATEEEIKEASHKATVEFANIPLTLDEMAKLTKTTGAKPTLVPTGIKCRLDPGTYLELSVRSSCPLKYWLILANGSAKIDADYYNNLDNEGLIFFQLINLSPFPILLKKNDRIGQGIIYNYLTTEDDNASGSRAGGLGSTGQ